MALWEYLWAGSWVTKLLYHLNWNANDSSWNGINWTASNVSWIWWTIGSGAAGFNWTSSVITTTHKFTSNNFTIACWVKSNTNNKAICIQWAASSLRPDFWLPHWIFTSGKLEVFSWWIIRSVAQDVLTSSTTITGNLIFVVATKDSSWNGKIYINWKLDATLTWMQNLVWTWEDFCVGRWRAWDGKFLDWMVDELIIENRVWTAIETQRYYTYTKWRFI